MTSMVWEHSNTKGPHRLVMLALADFADDSGFCWPSIPTVARKCAVSVRTAQRCIQDIRIMGELEVSESAGKRVNGGATNRFKLVKGGDKVDTTLPVKADAGCQSVTGCQIVQGGDKADTGGGVTGDAKVVTRLTPEPLVEPSFLPSMEPPVTPSASGAAKPKAKVVPSKTPPEVPLKQPQPHVALIEAFMDAYESEFGERPPWQNRNLRPAKEAVSAKITPEMVKERARRGWRSEDKFIRKQAQEFHGLWDVWSRLPATNGKAKHDADGYNTAF